MPAGIPVGTLAIGRSGAINAALLAAAVLALADAALAEPPRRLARQPDGQRRRAPQSTMNDAAPVRAGHDHRHSRRRPARPHAGDWPPPSSASRATSTARIRDSPAFAVAAARTVAAL